MGQSGAWEGIQAQRDQRDEAGPGRGLHRSPPAGPGTVGCLGGSGRGPSVGPGEDHCKLGSRRQVALGSSHPEGHTVAPGTRRRLVGSLT